MSDLTDEELDQRLWAEMRLEALPRSRSEALTKGERFYFTGKPCPKGHFAERRTKSRVCMDCHRAYQTKYRAEHREKSNAYSRTYRQKHRDELNYRRKLYDIYGTTKPNEIRMLAV